MAALFNHPEYMELALQATLKGCLPAPPTPEGRKVPIMVWVTSALKQRCAHVTLIYLSYFSLESGHAPTHYLINRNIRVRQIVAVHTV